VRRHLVLALTLPLALAGCGGNGYDTSGLEKVIRTKLGQHRGYRVRSVTCPKTAKVAKGTVIVCTATLQTGKKVSVRATELDTKGTVHLVISEMLADNVEHGIVVTLAGRSITATALCPEHVPVVVGKQFNCAVTGGRYKHVTVTIIDRDGGFRLRFF
jgi:hypothetical protein